VSADRIASDNEDGILVFTPTPGGWWEKGEARLRGRRERLRPLTKVRLGMSSGSVIGHRRGGSRGSCLGWVVDTVRGGEIRFFRRNF